MAASGCLVGYRFCSAGSVVHPHALLPSWSAITVYEGAWPSPAVTFT
jgi:hypothetical protein